MRKRSPEKKYLLELDIVSIIEDDLVELRILNGNFIVQTGAIYEIGVHYDNSSNEVKRSKLLQGVKEYWIKSFNIYVE